MSAAGVTDCYIALELSQRTWLVGYLLPGSDKVQTVTVADGNAKALLSALLRIQSMTGNRSPSGFSARPLRVCFEAGYDGFGLPAFSATQARVMLIELAWCWLKYQPQSQLARWYCSRFSGHGSRSGKVGVVALARKLAIAFRRFIEDGVVPEGATLSVAAK